MNTVRAIRLLAEFVRVVVYQLTSLRRGVGGDVARWHARALLMPDATLRSDALLSLSRKRASIEGAALFCILPARRSPKLRALLVTYQILADYLDEIDEKTTGVTRQLSSRLQASLLVALTPDQQAPNTPQTSVRADAGYLVALIGCCQTSYASLPSSAAVEPLVVRAAALAQVQCINHDPDPSRRERELRAWVKAHNVTESGLRWFEYAAAASAWLTVHALLAVAADSDYDESVVNDVYQAYQPWVSLLGTMLDSYADLVEDRRKDRHSYIAYYFPTDSLALPLGMLVDRAMGRVANCTRHASRHQVIVASMVAMYIATADPQTPELDAVKDELLRVGGWLLGLTMLASRVWTRLLVSDKLNKLHHTERPASS